VPEPICWTEVPEDLGTLRKQRVCWDGTVRDTVYFSILDEEWPDVRERLLRLLQRGA